ncbi:MAG: histidine kinase [Saprospiraceae bacterium]|nr:histidine kinase [Saprospiraceae bacterium]
MKLPKYTGKDYYVLALVLIPISVALSYAAMGKALFADFRVFLTAILLSSVILAIYFMCCGWWAVLMKQRFVHESDTGKKLFFMIVAFLMMSGFVLLLIFNLFENIPFFNYKIEQSRFIWAYIGLGFVNIFLSFLFEGISRFEEWKANLRRKEQLQLHFQQSQLQGLKSQVSPHFLFNSLNSLSSLIEEDTEAAERFLDEMSKVYRYMLRPEDEQLATLKKEIQFIESYFHLLKVRFGESLQTNIRLAPEHLDYMLPSLTLQTIVEDAIRQNTMSKNQPLVIEIGVAEEGILFVRHNTNPKTRSEVADQEGRLEEMISRYQQLQEPVITVREEYGSRTISIPFINTIETAWK